MEQLGTVWEVTYFYWLALSSDVYTYMVSTIAESSMIVLYVLSTGKLPEIQPCRKTYPRPNELSVHILRTIVVSTATIQKIIESKLVQIIKPTLSFHFPLLTTGTVSHGMNPWPATTHIILITLSPLNVSIRSFDVGCLEICNRLLPFERTENTASKGWGFPESYLSLFKI